MLGLKGRIKYTIVCLMCAIPLDAGLFITLNLLKNPHLLSGILFVIDLFVGISTIFMSFCLMVYFANLATKVKKDE